MEQTIKRPLYLIIDGSSLLSTCYYATLPLEIKIQKSEEEREKLYGKLMHSKDGVYTNAVYGFSMTLVSILRDLKPDRITVVFDRTKDTFRRKLYPEYKAQRKETARPLKEQFKLMQEILFGSGFHVLSSSEYEADDLAGTLTELNKESCRIRLYTKDRDYLQLVNDAYDVRCLMHTDAEKAADFRRRYGGIFGADEVGLPPFYKTTIEHTESTVFGELGVYPRNVVDLKAIEGDTSDNIPGVKGVSSAAAPLINEYGSLEAIYQTIENSKTAKEDKELNTFWKENLGIKRSPLKALREHKDEAFLSKTLACIKRDIPIKSGAEESMVKNISRDSFNLSMNKLDIKSVRL